MAARPDGRPDGHRAMRVHAPPAFEAGQRASEAGQRAPAGLAADAVQVVPISKSDGRRRVDALHEVTTSFPRPNSHRRHCSGPRTATRSRSGMPRAFLVKRRASGTDTRLKDVRAKSRIPARLVERHVRYSCRIPPRRPLRLSGPMISRRSRKVRHYGGGVQSKKGILVPAGEWLSALSSIST